MTSEPDGAEECEARGDGLNTACPLIGVLTDSPWIRPPRALGGGRRTTARVDALARGRRGVYHAGAEDRVIRRRRSERLGFGVPFTLVPSALFVIGRCMR